MNPKKASIMEYCTIKQAAESHHIAEIRIWLLIRQKKLSTSIIQGQVYVNSRELLEYANKYPEQIQTWQSSLAKTRRGFMDAGYSRS